MADLKGFAPRTTEVDRLQMSGGSLRHRVIIGSDGVQRHSPTVSDVPHWPDQKLIRFHIISCDLSFRE